MYVSKNRGGVTPLTFFDPAAVQNSRDLCAAPQNLAVPQEDVRGTRGA